MHVKLAIAIVLAATACSADDPCDGTAGACVSVTITGGAAVDTVQLDIAYGARHDRIDRAATSLPVAIAIRLDDDQAVSIVAASLAGGRVTGAGYGTTTTGGGITIALGAAPTCTAGTNYCGGDQLPGDPNSVYRCAADGAPEQRGTCLHGCAKLAGACTTGDACHTGHYCGGDKVVGDPHALYLCSASGTYMFERDCGQRCVVAPEGQDDYCAD